MNYCLADAVAREGGNIKCCDGCPHWGGTVPKSWSNEMMGGYAVRTFDTGATRDTDHDKIDPEGFLSPLVIERYCEYMHLHRRQANGAVRDSDNWQKGIPLDAYMKSLWRHFLHVWKLHRQGKTGWEMEDALCALLFNANGYIHETLKKRSEDSQKSTASTSK